MIYRVGNTNILLIYILSVIVLISIISSAYAISDENLEWFGGITHKVTPKDNMITDKGYTIKVTEFPAPVRGIKVINGTVPERPVTPFIKVQLYKDIINNPNPVDTFSLGIDDEYITDDKELKITLVSMPRNMSQSWVYEYYDPWASIKIQRRATPILSIKFKNDTDTDSIYPGDTLKLDIRIKNVGNDSAKNVNYDINIGILTLKYISGTDTLKGTIGELNKDEEKLITVTLKIPILIERKDYNISVKATGYDSLDKYHSWNASYTIKTKDVKELMTSNKITKSSIYLKENINVILTVTNMGPLSMKDIKIYDSIPDGLFLVKDDVIFNTTEIFIEKNYLGIDESFTYTYTLKPTEPKIYVLPKFIVNFSFEERQLAMTSNEQGFRVFGPKVMLNKSAMYKGNDIIDVNVNIKNIGNGIASRVSIDEKLPVNATLISGNTHIITSLDGGEQKVLNYTIKIPGFKGVNSVLWPKTTAIYYLDDYKFSTSSEKMNEEISKDLVKTEKVPTELINETPRKKVVATIARTPKKTPEKGIPGFRFYELLGTVVIILLVYNIKKKRN